MKKLFASILVVCMMLALFTACGTTESTAPADSQAASAAAVEAEGTTEPSSDTVYTIKIPYDYAEGHFESDLLMNFFAPQIEERSGGTLKVECYPGNILGSQEQIYEGVRNGMYEMAVIGVICQDLMPQVAALQFPFLFEDFETAKAVLLDENYGRKILEGCEDYGFKILSFNPVGFRVMTLNEKIESIDGFKGFKMRTPTIANMVQIFENLGCLATPMAMGEVYSGLEQGVVDGQENPPSTIRSSGWYEVQDYMLISNHVFNPDFLVVNVDFWNNLSDAQRAVIEEVSTEFQSKMWEASEKAESDDLQYMIDNSDIEVYYPSAEFKQEMIDATSVMYDNFYNEHPEFKDMVEAMRNYGK